MADEKDIKDEAKADEAKAADKAESKPAAKKESKPKAEKKASAEKDDSKDSGEKAAKKESKKASKADKAPKADKAEKAPKAEKAEKGKDEKAERKPRRRAKKADKAEAKKPAPSRRRRRETEEVPVVRASAKYVRVAPRKARLIADQVRGMHIEKARALLAFSPRGAAEDIHKLIDSAAANAENNHDLVGDEMVISSITVDEGPTLRRFRPRALGRATPINKRTSHIAVALTPVEDD
ncbi:MAG: ribosomal protein [Solirubrobacterales bacterium]|nr:ribosomal protein [Solirubrobacterales bacterium]